MNLPGHSEDASPYLGLPPGTISWGTLDARLSKGCKGLPGGSSLHKLYVKMGLAVNTRKIAIKQAIRAYFDEHGEVPNQRSGDASVYLGLPPGTITWSTLDDRLRKGYTGLSGGSSLAKLKQEMGLVVEKDTHKIAIEQAIRTYFDEHGKRPVQLSGDASPYLGLPPGTISWGAIDGRLRQGHKDLPGGSSLRKLCVEMGLPITHNKVSIDGIKQAIRAYFDEHGKYPVQRSGDASPYLGLPPGTISWDAINARLRRRSRDLPGDSSLHKLCVEMQTEGLLLGMAA